MGALRTVALVILAISAFTFIALFGRLPIFRKTPVAILHRLVWVHFPNSLAVIDSRLFGGRLVRASTQFGSYLWNDNHPLVLIFFVGLLAGGEFVFLPAAWPRMSDVHTFWVPLAVILPYFFIYKCVMTKSFITPDNHDDEMKRYPYDRVLFHPGHDCETCNLTKPPRSKHCSICKACISRHDHHCIWLMNCIGARNYVYFLALLLSLSVLLIYGVILGHTLLTQTLMTRVPAEYQDAMKQWSIYFQVWSLVITADSKVGTVTLLMFMTAPLAAAFLVYHTYLIWAGTTTNETSKWSDLKEDIEDGFAFKAKRSQISNAPPYLDLNPRPWPVRSDQILVMDEDPPMEGFTLATDSNRVLYDFGGEAPVDTRWTHLRTMNDVDNIYDLGFKKNLREALGMSVRQKL